MADDELIEFQKIYGLINPKKQNSAALDKCLRYDIGADIVTVKP